MSRTLKVAGAFVVALAAAQLVRPEHTNPPTDTRATLEAQLGTATGLIAVIDQSCRDCHSNKTVWPWYTQIAPLSWVITAGVKEGRKVLNFSEWGSYSPERRHELLRRSCVDVSDGKMPGGAWVLLHPEARLSADDIKTICTAARQPEVAAAQDSNPERKP